MGSVSRYIFFAKDVAPGGRLTMGHCTETKKIDWVALKRADWCVNTMSFQAVIFQFKIHLCHCCLSSFMSFICFSKILSTSIVVFVLIVMPSIITIWGGVMAMSSAIIIIWTSIDILISISPIFFCFVGISLLVRSSVRHFASCIQVKTDTESIRI